MQKLRIAETLCIGHHRETEEFILKSVAFSASVNDKGKVEVEQGIPTKLRVSFDMGQGQTMSKTVETYKAANDWLLSMSESMKQGSLSQNLRKMERDVRSEVEMEKAADKIFASAKQSLPQIANDQPAEENGFQPCKAEDVTSSFLNPPRPATVDLVPSSVSVHKGSLNNFVSLAYSDQTIFGVLFGKTAWNGKFHCTNIVLSNADSVDEILANPKVTGTCKCHSLTPCGLLVAGTCGSWLRDEEPHDLLQRLFTHGIPPLLIEVDYSQCESGVVSGRELNLEANEMRAVSVSHVTQPHDVKKRLVYNICWAQDLGVSHIEAATKKVCEAILKRVLQQTQGPQQPVRRARFKRIDVPGDGWCGWHCLLAAQNPRKWELVPRSEFAWAQNLQVQKQEETNARNLHRAVCQKALDECDAFYYPAIRRVMKNPSFSPGDLEWISYVCSSCARVTCAREALG